MLNSGDVALTDAVGVIDVPLVVEDIVSEATFDRGVVYRTVVAGLATEDARLVADVILPVG